MNPVILTVKGGQVVSAASTQSTYDWLDFESEPELTGDGSGCADTYILTIRQNEEEFATIVHRTCGGKYPISGHLAEAKRRNAAQMVHALAAEEASR